MRLHPFLRYAGAMGLNSFRVDLYVISGLHEPLQLRGMKRTLSVNATALVAREYFREAIGIASRLHMQRPPLLLVLHGLKRHRPGDYARLKLESPPSLNQHAYALAKSSQPYVCVQWRAEDSTMQGSVIGMSKCAASLVRATKSRMASFSPALDANRGRVLAISDIFSGTSDTVRQGASQASARRILLQQLPISPIQHVLASTNDTGLRGILELQVCARALLVMTCGSRRMMAKGGVEPPPRSTEAECFRCVKTNSGFTRHLIDTRLRLQHMAGSPPNMYYW
eukprot:scaffold145067_cov37-Tisochrysis_lutea.AAC.1